MNVNEFQLYASMSFSNHIFVIFEGNFAKNMFISVARCVALSQGWLSWRCYTVESKEKKMRQAMAV